MTALPSPLRDDDRWSLNEGTHATLYRVLGAHPDGHGTTFRVWAPSASRVEILSDRTSWSAGIALTPDTSGVWSGYVENVIHGDVYKYRITGPSGVVQDKADPFAFKAEEPPRTGSVVWDLAYEWGDEAWMRSRTDRNNLSAPISIYELHLGSWRYEPGGYRAIALQLADYVVDLGFTHVEILPVMEHPFYGSWGYQTTGYFAPTSRFGDPQDFMYLVDLLHERGIGVILDWVPSHFPSDAYGLAEFDGTHLYEHADPREGYHQDWDSLIFNYGRHEVRSFLLSSAIFWLDLYHADGIRVDAVASMLYRDYSRKAGEWIPNEFGGRENLEAISFLQLLNTKAYGLHPGIQMFAEESTAFPNVTSPVEAGGLGFGEKWDMGWMNDTLAYVSRDPIHRTHHHAELSFRMVYAFTENFTLPLSHDEVVHGKGSLLDKQPGDRWQQFAGLRLLYGYQWAQPGKKLLFMGGEFAVPTEWDHEQELDWGLLVDGDHRSVQRWVKALNGFMTSTPALFEHDNDPTGFRWVVGDDAANSVYAFLRLTQDAAPVLFVANFTPVVRTGYRIGVPVGGIWSERLTSDDLAYGGSGVTNGDVIADTVSTHGFDHSIELTIPPLGAVFLTPESRQPTANS
ncbi:MAG: 1,4-alpha-glucan branching protein GlgB [Actinomycetia bacterium]|nr:1,4-alpha-glucan branching protein GlgB [Actinomycetes bacterium]